MRSVFFVLAAAAAEAASKSGAENPEQPRAFITFGTAFNFARDSVLLSFDLSVFFVKRAHNRLLSILPHDVSKPINDLQTTASDTYAKARKDNEDTAQKIVEFVGGATDQVVGLVIEINKRLEILLAPLQDRFTEVFDDFRKQYPEAPLLPTSLLDRLFFVFFLMWVFTTALRYCLTCACFPWRVCRKICFCCRKKEVGRQGRYTNNKQKKKN